MSCSLKKHDSMVEAWKTRSDYKGYDKTRGSSFNSWRSIIYTQKGKNIGFPKDWKSYDVFISEVQGLWERGRIAIRIDTSLPHGKENTVWADKGQENVGKLVRLEYDGITKTLPEWCEQYALNYQGVRQRYFKGKNITTYEILFGKIKKVRNKVDRDFNHRVLRMLGAYRLADSKKGFVCDITIDMFRELIPNGCTYCKHTERIGLDRIDNSKGHVVGNVVPCCYECNIARSNNFTFEEMLIIGKSIQEIRRQRDENK